MLRPRTASPVELRASTFGVSSRSLPSHHIHHKEQGQEQADDADARPATVMLGSRRADNRGPYDGAPVRDPAGYSDCAAARSGDKKTNRL
jgi:hypothetical protein